MCSSCPFQGTKRGDGGEPWEGCQQGGLASRAQCSHNGQGVPEEESGESNMAKDDNGEPGEWRTSLSEQTQWTSVNSERHQVMFSVLSFPICSISKLPHQHETHHKFVFAFFSVSIWLFFCLKCFFPSFLNKCLCFYFIVFHNSLLSMNRLLPITCNQWQLPRFILWPVRLTPTRLCKRSTL